MGGSGRSRKSSLQRIIDDSRTVFVGPFQRIVLPVLTKFDALEGPQRLVGLWIVGSLALVLLTFACFHLGLNFASTAFVFLIAIIFLSLLDSLISSALFSAIALASLNYFFVRPLYTLVVSDPEDLITLAAFLITSLSVTTLVRRVRGLRLSEEQTRIAEARLRAAIDTVPVNVWSTMPDGRNDFHNQRLLSYTGFSAEHALGAGWADMLHPDDADRHAGAWRKAVETGTSFECESRLRRFDGQYRWFLARAEPLRDERGIITKWYGTNVDIHDRKLAEQALGRSEAYLAEAQKLSRSGSFGWNVSTGRIIWSAETFRIFGYEPTTTPSVESVDQRIHPDDVDRARQVLEGAAQDGRDFELEHRLLLPDGSIKQIHVVARATRDEQGGLEFVGAVMDVTEERRAYAALVQSEQRYRHLFDDMPISLWQLNASRLVDVFRGLRSQGVTDLAAHFEGHPGLLGTCMEALTVAEVNQHTVKLFGGRDVAEFVGRPVAPFWAANPGTFRRAMESRFKGEAYFEEETRFTTLDGRVFDALFTASRVGTSSDLGISLVGVIDISQRVRAQERLQQVQADFAHAARVSMLGELAASIAHEVTQPLAAIAANGEAGLRWMRRPEPDIAEVLELTESIVSDARRAADIISRIRAMAVGKAPEPALLSLDEVIREALLFLGHEIQARAVSVTHHAGVASMRLLGDRTQLQQVVVNLAINAMQAMTLAGSANRKLGIRTDMPDASTVRCTIEDSGPGVKLEHLDRLFESFFTTKEDGIGMGLPICRSIIEAHGGRIAADNGSTEGGARFCFTLPVAAVLY